MSKLWYKQRQRKIRSLKKDDLEDQDQQDQDLDPQDLQELVFCAIFEITCIFKCHILWTSSRSNYMLF